MKVRPLHDRLLVRRIAEKETAQGGIIIPDTAKEKPRAPADREHVPFLTIDLHSFLANDPV